MSISNTPNDALDGGKNKVNIKIDKVADSVHVRLNALSDKAHNAVNKVVPTVEAVTDRAHDAIDNAASAAAPLVESIAKHVQAFDVKRRHIANDARKCIRERPGKSLLIALGAGYLLAKIL